MSPWGKSLSGAGLERDWDWPWCCWRYQPLPLPLPLLPPHHLFCNALAPPSNVQSASLCFYAPPKIKKKTDQKKKKKALSSALRTLQPRAYKTHRHFVTASNLLYLDYNLFFSTTHKHTQQYNSLQSLLEEIPSGSECNPGATEHK